MRPCAVVVDVDDTLYLEREYVRSGLVAVEAHLVRTVGVGGLAAIAWDEFERGARGDLFDRALRRLDAADVRPMSELVEVYRSHRPSIALAPDAARFLARVAAAGLPLGAVTDGPATSQRAKLRALGLDADGPLVVVTAELGPGRGKPAPDAFLRIQAATGLAGPDLVYVADNPLKDFVAPRALGWSTVRVRRAGGLHADLPSGADVGAEVEDLDEAAALLVPDRAGRAG